jgi:thiamine kinase-like enzyme
MSSARFDPEFPEMVLERRQAVTNSTKNHIIALTGLAVASDIAALPDIGPVAHFWRSAQQYRAPFDHVAAQSRSLSGTTPMSWAESRVRALPLWNGAISIEPLKGGLSNESFLVEDVNGKHVVRFGKDFPFHHVFRDRELMVARAAAAAGFAPKVEFAEPGVMVSAFLGATTYGADDVRANRARIAKLMRNFHTLMPKHVSGAGFMFWVFHVNRDYARTLEAGKSRMVERLPEFLALNDALEALQQPLLVVFGHNDLLPANFLDDGKKLWLIDFEYAGFNTAMFDLAGAASNAGMSAEESEALLAEYFGGKPEGGLVRSHAAMQCASLLREAMWSMVSELHLSAPGADYVAYTAENLARLDAALDNYQKTYGKLA